MARKTETPSVATPVTIPKQAAPGQPAHIADTNNVAGPALIEQASKALAAEVAHHIETMYPDAAKAVSWASCKRSLSGLTQNTMKRLGDAAEIGQMDQAIKDMAAHRREINRLRKIGEMAESARKRREQEEKASSSVSIAEEVSQDTEELRLARLERTMSGTVGSIWRHKKRGTEYRIIAHGKLQIDGPLDMEEAVVYQDTANGSTWVRPISDFFDGRFELASQ